MEVGAPPPTPVDGADAARGRRGGPAVLLDEGITGLLIGGGGAVDAILVACYCPLPVFFAPWSLKLSSPS